MSQESTAPQPVRKSEPLAVTVLREAKARIGRPELWLQGAFSYVGEEETGPCCADGALLLVTRGTMRMYESRASSYLSAAARARGFETASKLNDAPTTTHADVLALFDDAIARAAAS